MGWLPRLAHFRQTLIFCVSIFDFSLNVYLQYKIFTNENNYDNCFLSIFFFFFSGRLSTLPRRTNLDLTPVLVLAMSYDHVCWVPVSVEEERTPPWKSVHLYKRQFQESRFEINNLPKTRRPRVKYFVYCLLAWLVGWLNERSWLVG